MKNIFTIAIILLACYAQTAFGDPQLDKLFQREFKNIIIDTRGDRGGNGDVAAGYLTIMDFLTHYGFNINITVLVNSTTKKILERLAYGNTLFNSVVKIETLESLPENNLFDLYLVLANPSDTIRYGNDITELYESNAYLENIRQTQKLIKIKPNGIMMAQTVLGNTENPASRNSNALIRGQGINYDMQPAGLGHNESGIYRDYIAQQLRNQTAADVKKFILEQTTSINDKFTRNSIQAILHGAKLKGATIGLSYGISAAATQDQFMSYLSGLSKFSSSTESFCIFTPSRFSAQSITDESLRTKLTFIAKGEVIPDEPEPGRIYIVTTETLPHKVFVGLMAYSMKKGLVPIGAGDGFMSAAMTLGGPFALTRVAWNKKNIFNLRATLLKIAEKHLIDTKESSTLLNIFNEIFNDINLERTQDLKKYRTLFANLDVEVPYLSDSIIRAALTLRKLLNINSTPTAEFYKEITDPILRSSIQAGGETAQLTGEAIQQDQGLKWETNINESTPRLKSLTESTNPNLSNPNVSNPKLLIEIRCSEVNL